MAIHLFEENISIKIKNKLKLKNWIKATILAEKKTLGELNYVFCSDEYLHEMNVEYLQHDTLTDIITFDNSEKKDEITGDIFISVDRVVDNADKFKVSVEDELHRVMVHGVLHLIGYKDKKTEEKETMRFKEIFYLNKRG